MNANKVLLLRQFTLEELKAELAYRKTLERAKKHLPSAEASLAKAQAKVQAYRDAMAAEKLTQTPIDQIKSIRARLGVGLKEAKDAYEAHPGDPLAQDTWLKKKGYL